MLLDISIIPQTSEELFYFVTKRIPYLCGFWRFANAYSNWYEKGGRTMPHFPQWFVIICVLLPVANAICVEKP